MSDTGKVPQAPLHQRSLGRTGLEIGEVGFGAWAIGGGARVGDRAVGFGDTDDDVSLMALARAFELGVNFVDTADAYGAGHSEVLIGKALRQSPRRVYIASKVGNVRRDPEPSRKDFSPGYIRMACDRSLNRLGVTTIDVYQLHNPPRDVIGGNEVWDTLRDLKDLGKIAHYGISIGAPEEGLLAMDVGEVETIQVVYNLLERAPAAELFHEAEKRGVGIIVRVPLASGLLTGKYGPEHLFADNDHRSQKYPPDKLKTTLQRVDGFRFLAQDTGRTLAQAALKFCLAPDAVSVVIPGIKTPQQIEENVVAARVPDLTPEELKKLEGL